MVNKNEEMSSAMTSDNATIPFVSNSNGQDAVNKENIDMSKRSATQPPLIYKSDSDCLHTVTLDEIMQTVYEDKPPIIDKLLYVGINLFAGPPKIGKSFLTAQIAYSVSTGQPLWEGYNVHQCVVLYLDLENTLKRVQARMDKMYGGDGSKNLYYAIPESLSAKNLENKIERFLKEHPDCRLVIIDTL